MADVFDAVAADPRLFPQGPGYLPKQPVVPAELKQPDIFDRIAEGQKNVVHVGDVPILAEQPKPKGPAVVSVVSPERSKQIWEKATKHEDINPLTYNPLPVEEIDKELSTILPGPFAIHRGIIRGVLSTPTPLNAAIAASSGGLGAIAESAPPVASAIAKLAQTGLSGYFATDMGRAALRSSQGAYDAWKRGDVEGVFDALGEAGSNAAMAYLSGRHAVHAAHGIAPAVEEARAAAELNRAVRERRGYQFVSPNEEENIDFAEAVKRLDSDPHQQFVQAGKDIDQRIGLNANPVSAIGDWSDGAENTVFNVIRNAPNFDAVRYSAALKGDLANQKAVIPFLVAKDGPDSLYRITMNMDLADARKALDSAGIQFRTLIPGKGGTEAVVFDPGAQLRANVEQLAENHGEFISDIAHYRGNGEFLGGDTREDGRTAYRQVIQDYESRYPGSDGREPGAGVPDAGRAVPQETAEVNPPAEAQAPALEPATPQGFLEALKSRIPFATYRNGKIWANGAMMSFLDRGWGVKSRESMGMMIDPEQMDDLIGYVTKHPWELARGGLQFLRAASQSAAENQAHVVVATDQPLGQRIAVARHETLHQTQNAFPLTFQQSLDLINHPVGQKIASNLAEEHGYNPNDQVAMAMEVGAALAEGPKGWDAVGITRDEAKDLFRVYVDQLNQTHGAKVFENLNRLTPQLNGVLNEARQAASQVQPGGNGQNSPVGAGAAQGEFRPDVRQSVPAQAKRKEQQFAVATRDWEPQEPIGRIEKGTIAVPAAGKLLMVPDVAKYLEQRTNERHGALPDDATPEQRRERLYTQAKSELQDQLQQPNNGANWYSEDQQKADQLLQKQFPELAQNPTLRAFQKILSSVMSNKQNPRQEAKYGAMAYEMFRETGQIPLKQPNGKRWPAQGATPQLLKMRQMIDKLGLDGFVQFVNDRQTVKDIRQFRDGQKGKANDIVPGAVVLGDKIGRYYLALDGRLDDGTVVDRWDVRGWRRREGKMFDPAGNVIEAPRPESDRPIYMGLHKQLADEFGLQPEQAQSLLWHYEQNLYNRLGMRSEPFLRSDGIQAYLDSKQSVAPKARKKAAGTQ